jgi:outer membrane protein OmpA-like peptidoglycan-associated protein
MRPAVLFAGDVTSFVVWAVTRDGKYENLGELWVRDENGDASFSTGMKEFALLVTAESHALVDDPSELVVFTSQAPAKPKGSRVTPIQFARFVPAPRHDVESIAGLDYTLETPLDLVQAQKAFELAQRAKAEEYAPGLMREARITLAQANALATASGRRKELADFSRRTVSLSSEAMRVTNRKVEEKELEQRIASRKAEMEALESRARSAESTAATAKRDLEKARAERTSVEAEMARLGEEKLRLEDQTLRLEAERAALEKQKAELLQRLQNALSRVAETKSTARGFIVNLPDILFDTNEATLKPEAKITIAKLSGIMLLMAELNVRIEGHTDATGSAAYNMKLSQQRAESVLAFLTESGLASGRMTAVGYGMERPLADNTTADGRARNRRVELVIAEGQIGAPQ